MKTLEEKKSWVRSLTYNTLKVKKACWSFGMETKTNDKWVNYSYGPTKTKQQVA
jgi:hypothetical protein